MPHASACGRRATQTASVRVAHSKSIILHACRAAPPLANSRGSEIVSKRTFLCARPRREEAHRYRHRPHVHCQDSTGEVSTVELVLKLPSSFQRIVPARPYPHTHAGGIGDLPRRKRSRRAPALAPHSRPPASLRPLQRQDRAMIFRHDKQKKSEELCPWQKTGRHDRNPSPLPVRLTAARCDARQHHTDSSLRAGRAAGLGAASHAATDHARP